MLEPKEKPVTGRIKWTEKEKKTVCGYFQKHIKNKIPRRSTNVKHYYRVTRQCFNKKTGSGSKHLFIICIRTNNALLGLLKKNFFILKKLPEMHVLLKSGKTKLNGLWNNFEILLCWYVMKKTSLYSSQFHFLPKRPNFGPTLDYFSLISGHPVCS